MTVNVRSRLFGSMRAFFESELCGVFTWDQIEPHDAELAPKGAHGRRNPFGNYREVAGVRFGHEREYDLVVKSPEEVGPLGEVVLVYPGGDVERGPIDSKTWKRLGKIICERELTRVNGHG